MSKAWLKVDRLAQALTDVGRVHDAGRLICGVDAGAREGRNPGLSDAVEPQETREGRALDLSGQLQAVTDS